MTSTTKNIPKAWTDKELNELKKSVEILKKDKSARLDLASIRSSLKNNRTEKAILRKVKTLAGLRKSNSPREVSETEKLHKTFQKFHAELKKLEKTVSTLQKQSPPRAAQKPSPKRTNNQRRSQVKNNRTSSSSSRQ